MGSFANVNLDINSIHEDIILSELICDGFDRIYRVISAETCYKGDCTINTYRFEVTCRENIY